ncbi:MAG: GldG family protein, partial [Clostridiales bacterium]|nr:GldG family protein [Clostridiales bacterium]
MKKYNPIKSKRFRYGAFSTIMIVIVMALLIAVNSVVSLFDITFDLSQDQIFTMSEDSKQILNAVTEDVTIYALFKSGATGREFLQLKEMIDQYSGVSPRVKVVYRDPYVYPTFVESYKTDGQDIPMNSVIVESAMRFKVIYANELILDNINPQTGAPQGYRYEIEPLVTNAVKYVSNKKLPVIYQVTNHNEYPVTGSIADQIYAANYEFKTLNIMDEPSVPQDASAIILSAPQVDYTPDEVAKIKDYLAHNGRALVFALATNTEQTNFLSIIEAYGVTMDESRIIEGNPSNFSRNMPYFIVPNTAEHEITSNLPVNFVSLYFYASSFSEMEIRKNSSHMYPLLVTSNEAYSKSLATQSQILDKEEGDADGPFNVAVAVEDVVYTPDETRARLVLIGSANFHTEDANYATSGGNANFIVSALNWLVERDEEESVYISPKTINFTQNIV